MSCLNCDNHVSLASKKPKDWIERGYRIITPYPFKWRAKLGKVECDCKQVEELYEPYYGVTWFHQEECAVMRHFRKFPQMSNFMWERDPRVIAQTD